MKKYFTLMILAIFGGLFMMSCERVVDEPTVDNDTYSEVLDLRNVSFTKNATSGDWEIYRGLNLYNSDQMLVYRQSGTSNGNPIWQLIPRTLYLTQGELDYDFDFTKSDVVIKAGGNYDISTTPQYLTNQTFRLVILPGYFATKTTSQKVDFNDYNAVIKYYKIDDSKSKSL